MIFGTQMVLHDYHHGILNRMFSQETIRGRGLAQWVGYMFPPKWGFFASGVSSEFLDYKGNYTYNFQLRKKKA